MIENNLIICGGGLVENSLAVHFGRISPLFLPLKNKPLIEYQLLFSKLNSFENTFILIPEEEIPRLNLLQRYKEIAKVHFHIVDSDLDLINALENVVEKFNIEKACILLGDTLFNEKLSFNDENFISINESFLDFNWNRINSKDIASGLFYFNDISAFLKLKIDDSFKRTLAFYLETSQPKMIRPRSWLDFGHFSTYIKSKFNYTAERSFNQIHNTPSGYMIKGSSSTNKIIGEYLWFNSVPDELRDTIPNLKNLKIGNNSASYEISKVYLPNFAEVYLYGKIGIAHFTNIYYSWQDILEKFSMLKAENSNQSTSEFLEAIEMKTTDRIALTGIDIEENITLNNDFVTSIGKILKEIKFTEDDNVYEDSFYHGDFCLSNMFYDVNADQLILIDPRGVDFSGEINFYGNIIYDQAKLYHSIVGQYDSIIAGMYFLNSPKDNCFEFDFIDINRSNHIKLYRDKIQKIEKTLLKINIHLFLSMIPLHSDSKDRQQAFLANSIRLFKMYKDEF